MASFASAGIATHRVRLPRILSRVFFVMYALSGVTHLTFGAPALAGGVALLGSAGWLLLVVSFILWFTSSWVPGMIDVGAETVTVTTRSGKARVLRRAEIVAALAVDRAVGTGWLSTVEIELASGDRLTVRANGVEEARALVRELGFGEGGARVRTSLALPTRRLLHLPMGFAVNVVMSVVSVFLAVLFGSSSMYMTALLPALTVGAYLLVRRLVGTPSAVLGADGIVLETGLAKRFFALGDPRLALALRQIALVDDRRVVELLRLAGAFDVRAPKVARTELAAFAPTTTTLEAWRAALRQAMDSSSYRQAARTPDEAAAALQNPEASPRERVGAALALRIAGEPPVRIRVAADATADEATRDALEAVAADDDAKLQRAMKRLAR